VQFDRAQSQLMGGSSAPPSELLFHHADGRTESAAGFTEPPDSAAATRAWAGEHSQRTRVSLLTAVLMTVALTFHSLLEVTAIWTYITGMPCSALYWRSVSVPFQCTSGLAAAQHQVLLQGSYVQCSSHVLSTCPQHHTAVCDTSMYHHFQGAALGAARDMVHSAHIFVAIQAHKGLTAFALGCSLVESAAPPLQFWSLVRAPLSDGTNWSLYSLDTVMWCGVCAEVPALPPLRHSRRSTADTFIHQPSTQACQALCCCSVMLSVGRPRVSHDVQVLLMASATPVGIGVGLLVSGLTSSTGASAISAVAAGASCRTSFAIWTSAQHHACSQHLQSGTAQHRNVTRLRCTPRGPAVKEVFTLPSLYHGRHVHLRGDCRDPAQGAGGPGVQGAEGAHGVRRLWPHGAAGRLGVKAPLSAAGEVLGQWQIRSRPMTMTAHSGPCVLTAAE
jgi:hypothetical protein